MVKRQARSAPARPSDRRARAAASSRSTGSPTTCCAGDARRQRADAGRAGCARARTPDALGDRLVVADRRLPGGAPARRQRRHARVPLVGEGARQGDRHQPPARRGGARAPPLQRPRPAVRRRREPREHPLRRRAPQPADHEHGAAAATARAASGQDYFAYFANPYNVTRTLALVDRARWSASCWAAIAAAAPRRPARASTAALVYALMRAWATVIQRDLQVAAVIADMLRRPAGRLHDVPGLRRGRPPLRHRAPRGAARRCARSTARSAASPPRAPTRRGPTGSSCSPTTASRQGATFLRPLRHHARGARARGADGRRRWRPPATTTRRWATSARR